MQPCEWGTLSHKEHQMGIFSVNLVPRAFFWLGDPTPKIGKKALETRLPFLSEWYTEWYKDMGLNVRRSLPE